jgi:hypothetical protein
MHVLAAIGIFLLTAAAVAFAARFVGLPAPAVAVATSVRTLSISGSDHRALAADIVVQP